MAPESGQMTLTDVAQTANNSTDTATTHNPHMFIPAEHDAPEYDAISTQDELHTYTDAYISWAIDHHDMDIDTEYIRGINVTETKREAASVKRLKIPEGFVGTIGITPINWDAVTTEMSTDRVEFDHPKEIEFRFSWRAFNAFDEDTWKEVTKHELVHAEEFHQYGDTNHYNHFKTRANEINATIKCQNFTEYEYELCCSECGKMVGGRHRRSKVVKSAEKSDGKYRSECCGEALTLSE